jgi:Rod binding domain-containing protein
MSVFRKRKNHLRQSFEDWYADKIVKQLNENKGSESEDEVIQPVDLSLTQMKSLSAKWLVKMVQHIKNNPEIVRSGFRETGISDTLAESLEDEVPLSKVSRE